MGLEGKYICNKFKAACVNGNMQLNGRHVDRQYCMHCLRIRPDSIAGNRNGVVTAIMNGQDTFFDDGAFDPTIVVDLEVTLDGNLVFGHASLFGSSPILANTKLSFTKMSIVHRGGRQRSPMDGCLQF